MLQESFQSLYLDNKDEWSKDKAMFNQLQSIITPDENENKLSILDIGCGIETDYYNYFKNHQYLGIDIVSNNNIPNTSFINTSFLEYSLDQEFDLVLDNGCLHHQPEKMMKAYLEKVNFALNDNGLYSCCVWREPFSRNDVKDERDNHYFENADQFNDLLSKINMFIVYAKPFSNDQGVKMYHFLAKKKLPSLQT